MQEVVQKLILYCTQSEIENQISYGVGKTLTKKMKSINSSSVDEGNYSDEEKSKKKQKQLAKEYKKAFKGTENEKDYQESFGARESEGITMAIELQQTQLSQVKSVSKDII